MFKTILASCSLLGFNACSTMKDDVLPVAEVVIEDVVKAETGVDISPIVNEITSNKGKQ